MDNYIEKNIKLSCRWNTLPLQLSLIYSMAKQSDKFIIRKYY